MLPEKSRGLVDAIDRILDRGVVVNADISISVAGAELIGIKIRATLASFETAARYGMDFPSGTNMNAYGWNEAYKLKAICPECGNTREESLLIQDGCHICGWVSPRLKERR